MKLIIHRGANTIGGTCIELESSGHKLILDLGMPLPDPKSPRTFISSKQLKNQINSYRKKEILPNIPGLYFDEEPGNISILLSHVHGDHSGLLTFVHPKIKVFTSKGTHRLLEVGSIFIPGGHLPDCVTELDMWKPVQIGPFTVTAYLTDHSAPDALSFLIEADNKRIFYSGDIRGHGRKREVFDRFLANPPKNIDWLLMEGTMLSRPGPQIFPDEDSVRDRILQLLNEHSSSPAFVFCSSQNLDRICAIYSATRRAGRSLVIDLYTAFVLDQLRDLSPSVPQMNWEGVRIYWWHGHIEQLKNKGLWNFIDRSRETHLEKKDYLNHPDKYLFLEKPNPNFSKLASLLPSKLEMILIWSMWKGTLTGEDILSKFIHEKGLDLHYVHTSGHADITDLKRLLEAVGPRYVIPIHTEYPEKFSNHFQNVRIVDNKKIEVVD